MPRKSLSVDDEIKLAEKELAAGNVDGALARLARLQKQHSDDPMLAAVLEALTGPGSPGNNPAAAAAAAPDTSAQSASGASGPGTLKRASTLATIGASKSNTITSVPRGGTLVRLVGQGGLKALGLEKYKNRMGRVIEMIGRQFMPDGKTELATVLLDSRVGDYDRGNGSWVQVPLSHLELA